MKESENASLERLEKEKTQKVVGLKQTLRALENDTAKVVFIAEDADRKIIDKVKELAEKKKVQIVMIETMDELGKATQIKVGAATVAELKD